MSQADIITSILLNIRQNNNLYARALLAHMDELANLLAQTQNPGAVGNDGSIDEVLWTKAMATLESLRQIANGVSTIKRIT